MDLDAIDALDSDQAEVARALRVFAASIRATTATQRAQ
jgi:hypothetical protein